MAGASLQVNLVGDAAFTDALKAAAHALERPGGMFAAIGRMLVASTQQRFTDEAGPDGSPWPMSVRAMTQGGKTLTDKARLRNSITYAASDEGVEWGTNILYAGVHQRGATIKAKTAAGLRFKVAGSWVRKQEVQIPARPFLGIDLEDASAIAGIATDWLQKASRGGSNAG